MNSERQFTPTEKSQNLEKQLVDFTIRHFQKFKEGLGDDTFSEDFFIDEGRKNQDKNKVDKIMESWNFLKRNLLLYYKNEPEKIREIEDLGRVITNPSKRSRVVQRSESEVGKVKSQFLTRLRALIPIKANTPTKTTEAAEQSKNSTPTPRPIFSATASGDRNQNNQNRSEKVRLPTATQPAEERNTRTATPSTEDEFTKGIEAIAVGSTEGERSELIRNKTNTVQENERRQWLDSIRSSRWRPLLEFAGNIRRSFTANWDRFRMHNQYSQENLRQLLDSQTQSYGEIATKRARQLELDLQNSTDSRGNPMVGYEELQHRVTNEYTDGLKQLGDLIKQFVLNTDEPVYSKVRFEEQKNEIIEKMVEGQSNDVVRAARDQADTLWVRVEERRQRLESVQNRDEVIEKMNFNVVLRFGRARLTSETPEERTLTVRMEDLLLNNPVMSRIPFRKRHWAQFAIFSASVFPMWAMRESTKVFLAAPVVSGLSSGIFEYFRKRDELTGTRSRVTRMLARGEDISNLPEQLNIAGDLFASIDNNQIDVETLLRQLNASNTSENGQESSQQIQRNEETLARFYARHNLSRERNIDLFRGTSHQVIQTSRTDLLDRYYTYQRSLNDEGRQRLNQLVQQERSRIENDILTNQRLFERLRRSRSMRSAVVRGSVAATFSFGLSLVASEAVNQGAISEAWGDAQSQFGGMVRESKVFVDNLAQGKFNDAVEQAKLFFGDLFQGKVDFVPDVGAQDARVNPAQFGPQFNAQREMVWDWEPGAEVLGEEVALDGQEAVDELLKKSKELQDPNFSPVSDPAEQDRLFGSLTRSNWENDGKLSIVGRIYDPNDTRYFGKTLEDLSGKYADSDTFKVWVNFTDNDGVSHTIDASGLMSFGDNARGGFSGYSVDFSKDSGILGQIWKAGGGTSEGFLNQINNIQYGFALDSDGNITTDMDKMTTLQNVSTIKGNGNLGDLSHTIPGEREWVAGKWVKGEEGPVLINPNLPLVEDRGPYIGVVTPIVGGEIYPSKQDPLKRSVFSTITPKNPETPQQKEDSAPSESSDSSSNPSTKLENSVEAPETPQTPESAEREAIGEYLKNFKEYELDYLKNCLSDGDEDFVNLTPRQKRIAILLILDKVLELKINNRKNIQEMVYYLYKIEELKDGLGEGYPKFANDPKYQDMDGLIALSKFIREKN